MRFFCSKVSPRSGRSVWGTAICRSGDGMVGGVVSICTLTPNREGVSGGAFHPDSGCSRQREYVPTSYNFWKFLKKCPATSNFTTCKINVITDFQPQYNISFVSSPYGSYHSPHYLEKRAKAASAILRILCTLNWPELCLHRAEFVSLVSLCEDEIILISTIIRTNSSHQSWHTLY